MNGWTRLGIVASLLWVIGAGIYSTARINGQESEARGMSYSARGQGCYEARKTWPNDAAVTARNCEQEAFEAHENLFFAELYARDRWMAWIGPAIAVPFAWLFVLLIAQTVRWIRAGLVAA